MKTKFDKKLLKIRYNDSSYYSIWYDKKGVSSNLPMFENEESYISCGIREMDGINDIINSLNDNINRMVKLLTDCNVTVEIKELYETILTELFKRSLDDNPLYTLISTNITDNSMIDEALDVFGVDVVKFLDSLSFMSDRGLNPNSGNDIKLWVIKR
jgi:hypothetical protein